MNVGECSRATEPESMSSAEYSPDELLVVFREGAPESRIDAINRTINVEVIRKMVAGRVYLVKVPKDKSLEDTRRAFLSCPEVVAVDVNYKIRVTDGNNILLEGITHE